MSTTPIPCNSHWKASNPETPDEISTRLERKAAAIFEGKIGKPMQKPHLRQIHSESNVISEDEKDDSPRARSKSEPVNKSYCDGVFEMEDLNPTTLKTKTVSNLLRPRYLGK